MTKRKPAGAQAAPASTPAPEASSPVPAAEPQPEPPPEPEPQPEPEPEPEPAGWVQSEELDPAAIGAEYFDGRTLYVRSVSPQGRRRAGRAFGPEPEPVECDELALDQISALLLDPQLIVQLDD